MSRSITRRLIAYFVAVLFIFALLTAGIYIFIFRKTVMSAARENLFERGDRIAHLLVNWSFDDPDIDFCPDETDTATAGESSPEPSRGRWGEGTGKGNASASQGQGQGQGQGKGKQERRGVREYRVRTDRFLTWLSQIDAGELWLVDKKTETVLTATDKSVSTSELPESIDTLLDRVLAGESVYSEDFGTLFGTPSMTVGLPIRDAQGDIASALFLHTSVAEATSGLMAAWQGLLLSLVIALIVVVLLAILLSRHFIDPLKRLQRTTAKLADGDYRARTNLDMQDEIGQLGNEIDMLAERLEEAEGERHFTDASRRKFLSEISHELRTPVTVIRGSLEALRDGIVKEDDVTEYYATMSASAASLDRLIGDLLELTRLDNPEFTLDMEAVNLRDVVEDAVRQTRQIASQKGVEIDYKVSDEHDDFYGDYGRLRQMLVNILNNAVKFTPSGSRVFVDYRLRDAGCGSQFTDAVISIRDEGIGMSEETIRHLFDRFYTTGKAGTDSTGLGLSIAKSIADRHNVEIDVVSREGEGSTFTLSFPLDDRNVSAQIIV
ncbi:MAG: HAMP domain-containing histidine kinase [Clostridiaceae bacterium]|jgi:signal transduction histidine kinase|nr:HAMP domain-containing histidine kinase [Clostridiaceae bacterium]